MEAATLSSAKREQIPLIEGRNIRCPRCHTSQDILSYFVFTRPEGHEHDLNIVMKCRAKVPHPISGKPESCRCIFSVRDAPDEVLGDLDG